MNQTVLNDLNELSPKQKKKEKNMAVEETEIHGYVCRGERNIKWGVGELKNHKF